MGDSGKMNKEVSGKAFSMGVHEEKTYRKINICQIDSIKRRIRSVFSRLEEV